MHSLSEDLRAAKALTKAQRSLLLECKYDERGVTAVAANYAPAKILVRLGLAFWRDNDPYSERLIITDAGRRALAAAENGR